MTVAADLATKHGTRRRLALKIDGVEPIFWQSVGVGPDDLDAFDPPGRLPMSPDCVAKWTMDGATAASDETDATGHGHTAVQTGSPPVQTGKFGGARSFASGDYMTVADVASMQPQTFTVASWVYYDGNTGYYPKVFHYDHPTYDLVIVLQLNNGTKKLGCQVTWTDGTSNGPWAASDLSTGWHLVGGSYDGEYVRTWIDGACAATSSKVSKTVAYSTDYITIGNDRDDPTAQYWKGYLDETAFYNTAKSAGWWAQAYATGSPETRTGFSCLLPPAEASMGLDVRNAKLDWSGITFELTDVEDPDDPGASYFAKMFAPARWDQNTHWRLEWGTNLNSKLNANATSIVLADVTDLPAAGTLHIGQEVVTYSGISTHTITNVQKGLYPCIGTEPWGATYPLPTEASGREALAISDVPYSMHGRRAALYMTTWDRANHCWNPLSSAALVWVGRITERINFVPGKSRGAPKTWQLSCESLTASLDRKLATDLPSARLDKINLTGSHGRSFVIAEYNGTGGTLIASATVTVAAGVYDGPSELMLALRTAVDAVTGASWPGANPIYVTVKDTTSVSPSMFPYSPGSAGTGGPFEMEFASVAGPRIFKLRLLNGFPCHALRALGFDQPFDQYEVDIVAGEQVASSTHYQGSITGGDACVVYHPLDQRVNGAKLYLSPLDIDNVWLSQGDDVSAAAVLMAKEALLVPAWDRKGVYLARYTSITSNVPADPNYVGLTYDPLAVDSAAGYIGSAKSDDVPSMQQVFAPTYKTMSGVKRGPFTSLLYYLISTGTTDYNGSTYDKLPLSMSCAIQDDIVDTDSFLAADQAIALDPTAQRWDPAMGCYFIDEPTSFNELLQRECVLYGYALVWRAGKLTLVNVSMPPVDQATVTLNDTNSAVATEKPDTDQPTSTVVNRWECEVLTNHYTGKSGRPIIINDVDSQAGLGGYTSMVAVKHPGLPVPGGKAAPDTETIRSMLELLLVQNRGLRYPSQIVQRTVDATLENLLFVGDLVMLSSAFVPDPLGTGSMGFTGYAQVLNEMWDHATVTGQVTLRLLSQYADYGKPWAPGALVDHAETNAGWDAASRKLSLVAQQYSPVGRVASHDGDRFESSAIVRVLERDATAPDEYAGIEVVGYDSVAQTLELADDAATSALAAGWDTGKEYVVVFDDHDQVVSGQHDETFQAATTTQKLGSTRADRWG